MNVHSNSDGDALVIRLSGGLGNQMFQFAFGAALAGDRRLLFDVSALDLSHTRPFGLDCFALELEFSKFPLIARSVTSVPEMWRWMRAFHHSLPVPGGRLIWDAMEGFDARWPELKGNLYAVGYWQDERYFRSISDQIRSHFSFSRPFTDETNDLLSLTKGAVGVQVRRGDYTAASKSWMHPSQSVDYYIQSVKRLADQHGIRRVIVATDDTSWARQHLDLPDLELVFRSNEAPAWEDMLVLSRCDHVVISNSSFGWWAEWLGCEERSVVCPARWYGNSSDHLQSHSLPHWIES